MKKIEKTIKFQLIQFVKKETEKLGRPVTRREIVKEYERITGNTNNGNLRSGLCYGYKNQRRGYFNDCTEGYLTKDTGYGRIAAIGRNQYIAE